MIMALRRGWRTSSSLMGLVAVYCVARLAVARPRGHVIEYDVDDIAPADVAGDDRHARATVEQDLKHRLGRGVLRVSGLVRRQSAGDIPRAPRQHRPSRYGPDSPQRVSRANGTRDARYVLDRMPMSASSATSGAAMSAMSGSHTHVLITLGRRRVAWPDVVGDRLVVRARVGGSVFADTGGGLVAVADDRPHG